MRNNSTPTQAIFSVCVSPDTTTLALEAAASIPNTIFAGEFHHYITADKRPQFPPSLTTAASCVALIDFDADPDLALETATRLQQIFSRRISIIAIGTGIDAPLLLRAVRVGCAEFLTTPITLSDLIAALQRFQSTALSTTQPAESIGKVISFFGAKGGVGSTTLAVHLATHLVRTHNKRTLLIDHRHELGHVALYLGLKNTRYHFDELISNVDRLDAELLRGYILAHASGIDVLASPDTCAIAHHATRDQIDRVIDFLKHQYDYVLIDSSLAYKEILPSIIDVSDHVYLVSTPDVAALRDLARHTEHLTTTSNASTRLKIAINRSTSDDAVTIDQIAKAVRFPVSIAVPNNYFDLLRAINNGEPVAPSQKSPFTNQIAAWAEDLTPSATTTAPVPQKKSLAFWRKQVAANA